MKYFLDSAKLDEIQTAYNTFGIDGVTTNPRHIMLSGKPFLTAIQGIADWIKSEGLDGYERFPVSVEINPHLDETEAMLAEARKIADSSQEAGGRGNQDQCDPGILTGPGHPSGKKPLAVRIPVHRLEGSQRRGL